MEIPEKWTQGPPWFAITIGVRLRSHTNKSVLNVVTGRYKVGIDRCRLYTCKRNTLTVDYGKHLHNSLLTLHKLRTQTLPGS